jgi:hypothetical protein
MSVNTFLMGKILGIYGEVGIACSFIFGHLFLRECGYFLISQEEYDKNF